MTSTSLFGTDGMRGRANVWPITPQSVLNIALAAGQYVRRSEKLHRVIIGKDTRLSGYMLETALTAGFLSMGMDVLLLGPLPTPAVSILTHAMRADLGVMISASHNPHHDNGMKLFLPSSLKLDQAAQTAIEHIARQADFSQVDAEQLGRARRLNDAKGRYIEVAKQSLGNKTRFETLKVVIDCAHGAAYKVAPLILWELGAEVIPIGVTPDGTNINHDCGAMHPEALQKTVLAHGADAGIALDGDGDRIVVVDEKGERIDGEQLLAMILTDMQDRDILKPANVVTTKVTGRGFYQYCKRRGIDVRTTDVGDRNVSEEMQRCGALIGGETSGHIIFADYSYCSDGIIAALQVLRLIKEKRTPLSKLRNCYSPGPSLHHTVPWSGVFDPTQREPLQSCLADITHELGDSGRILVRKSGTEPVIRIMIECDQEGLIPVLLDRTTNALNAVSARDSQVRTRTMAPGRIDASGSC